MKTALTIAGSDCSGGAGIQADIKTMTANGIYGMSVITALTAQNTVRVEEIMEISDRFVGCQMDSIFTDIYPDSVKTGMLSNTKIIETVADKLLAYKAKNIVVDPVMVSTSGSRLIKEEAIESMKERMFTIATIITPNISEAEVITNTCIKDSEDMIEVAKRIYHQYGCAVLLKGGHRIKDANDVLYDGDVIWYESKRIDNPNTHGTGCTLSSAIASNLAKGYDLHKAIDRAKQYVAGALLDMLDLGMGSGPLNHAFDI